MPFLRGKVLDWKLYLLITRFGYLVLLLGFCACGDQPYESSSSTQHEHGFVGFNIVLEDHALLNDDGVIESNQVDDLVRLDGSASRDPYGDPLTYSWSFTSLPSGSAAQLTDPTTQTPSFVADLPGTHVLSLVVNDGTQDSNADSVTVIAGEPGNYIAFFDFEDGMGDWSADNGIWEVGTPTSGPSAAHSGSNVAGYVEPGWYVDDMLIEIN